MTTKIIKLAEALKDALTEQLGVAVERKYVAYKDTDSLGCSDTPMISVFPYTESQTVLTRAYNDYDFEIVVEVLQRIPENGDQSHSRPDAGLNYLEFLDEKMQDVEAIKNLFDDGGPLRDEVIGDCVWMGTEQPSLYNHDSIYSGIFWSMFKLRFKYGGGDN